MEQYPTILVLNYCYEKIGYVSWEKAITLYFLGKCEIEESYDVDIRSQNFTMKMPKTIRINKYIKNHISRKVRFNRRNVYKRDGYTCQYCGKRFTGDELTFDHVYPKSQGGTTVWCNIVTCCFSCNQKKNNRTPEQAKMKLVSNPVEPKNTVLKYSIRG